jgi:hypothetical protein
VFAQFAAGGIGVLMTRLISLYPVKFSCGIVTFNHDDFWQKHRLPSKQKRPPVWVQGPMEKW